jgi:hypothetical protein
MSDFVIIISVYLLVVWFLIAYCSLEYYRPRIYAFLWPVSVAVFILTIVAIIFIFLFRYLELRK